MRRCILSGMATSLVLAALATTPAQAATLSVDSKNITVGAGTVDIPVRIAGGENLSALAMALVVGDGGQVLGGTETIKITGFDTTGGIFDSGAFSINKGYGEPLPASATVVNIAITTANTNVLANGLLGVLHLDTSSAASMRTVLISPTNSIVPTTASNSLGQNLSLSFSSGMLTITIPEPASVVMLGLGTVCLLRRRRA